MVWTHQVLFFALYLSIAFAWFHNCKKSYFIIRRQSLLFVSKIDPSIPDEKNVKKKKNLISLLKVARANKSSQSKQDENSNTVVSVNTQSPNPSNILDQNITHNLANQISTPIELNDQYLIFHHDQKENTECNNDTVDELDAFFNEGERALKKQNPLYNRTNEPVDINNFQSNQKVKEEDKAEYDKICELIANRQSARRVKDYQKADEIRKELEVMYDIIVADYKGTWSTRDGRLGGEVRLPASRKVTCSLSEEQIIELVERRINARRTRNFELADQIRSELLENGVELLDKINEWRTVDGKYSGLQSIDFLNSDFTKPWYQK